MPIQKCDRKKLAKKIRETRKLRSKTAVALRPLFNHVIRLAVDSAKRGYCQRARQELAHARKLSTKFPEGLSGIRRRRKRR